MEIKFSYTFFGVREKQQEMKMNKSKTRNEKGTEKKDGKICMDVAQRRFLCVFFLYVCYILYSAVPQEHSTEHIFFPKLLGWGTKHKKRHWHQTISQLTLLFTYKAPGRPNDLIYNYVL